jgi:hypothetical protein
LSNSSDSINYGSRDDVVLHQSYSPVRKLDGLSHHLFAQYWRDVHGPLCSRLPGLNFYVQHHFSRTHKANLWPIPEGVKSIDVTLDGAVEIGFSNIENADKFIEASPILFGDEVNVFGWDAAFSLPNGSKTYVDKQVDGPNGPDQLHRLHIYMHGELDEEFRSWVNSFANQLVASPAVQKLRLHLPEPYDNSNPQPPSPISHYVPDDMRKIGVMEIGFHDALAARSFFESDVFKATEKGQAKHLKAIRVFFVTHVYTFVRDGTPTTAGLRGSSAAEVIRDVGAVNHLAPEVTSLFTRG